MRKIGVQGLLAATASIAIAIVTPATATAEQTREYHLPAQDLGSALRALGQASGGEIVFGADAVAGKRAPALDGSYTLFEAVKVLLSGSGLVATEKNGSILIRGRPGPPEGAAEAGETAELASDSTIIVTGTRIRGAAIASSVIALTRKDMAESGQTTIAAVIRDLPQNFNGGQNPGVGFGVPESSGTNLGSGTGLNLRGIGSDATLTLLDGHRVAYNLASNAVDVSAIPFEAVDRLEVVPDGSSALYGSDAVAGVVNIVLKDRFAGLRASARLGTSTDGGAFQQQYALIAGTDWKSGAIYAAYEFARDTAVTAKDRSFLQGRSPGLTLLPPLKHHSALIKGVQDLGGRLEFEVEALYDKRWSERSYALNAAGDYRLGGQLFRYETTSFVLAPSLKYDPGGDWRVVATGMFGLNRQYYDTAQFLGGPTPFPTVGCYCNKANSIELVADGPLARLPGGAVKLAIGGGYRKNILSAYRTLGTAQNIQVSQDAWYAFGELGVPLISEAQQAFIRSLTLSAAMRYENYPGLDQVATPKLGLIAAITGDITLKGSWGKSFKAPTLYQQYNSPAAILFGPATLGQTGAPAGATAIYYSGGNPDLKPERATTWSATLDLHPAWAGGLRLELSYFNIDYRDRVVSPINFLSQSLSNPIYADLVTRNPSAAAVAAILSRAQNFINATAGAFVPGNVVAIVDNGNTNAARQKIEGIISKMEAATNFLNSIQVNDCRLANRMVQIAKGDDNMSGIIEEMTGYKSLKEGFAKSYQQSREKIEANRNNPTEDLKDALENCPAEVTDIFRTGSLLAHAASRVGAGEWTGVMRARVGDVYMRWDASDKVPIFTAIPACASQDTETVDDFLTGKVRTRSLAVPATGADCSQDGTGKGALVLARARMETIANKIRTRAALTDEERQFVANVKTLPVYRMLEWGVRQGTVDSVIGDTDELVALTLAYQMLNDLTRTIDFAVSNAERGATTAGSSDETNAKACQTRILTKGLEQLRGLRDEVLHQRSQMRQSYMAAMDQANLSANYASLIRQRDRDARDAAGAAANNNR